jgi:hypothetical protein
VDSGQAHGELLNSRMAYVSVSRAQFDVQMYTNDAGTLGHALSRDVSHTSAIQPEGMQQQTPTQPDTARQIEPVPAAQKVERVPAHAHEFDMGYSL